MSIKHHKESEYTAVCERCGDTESIFDSDGEWRWNDTPSKYFRRHGWNDSTGYTLCPSCMQAALDAMGGENNA